MVASLVLATGRATSPTVMSVATSVVVPVAMSSVTSVVMSVVTSVIAPVVVTFVVMSQPVTGPVAVSVVTVAIA